MKNLQMPHSYASVPEEELYSISGGGPLGDALALFFSNLRLDDIFFGGGLISFSFTFVPLLLFSREEKEMVEYLSDQQQRKQQAQNPTNGFLSGC